MKRLRRIPILSILLIVVLPVLFAVVTSVATGGRLLPFRHPVWLLLLAVMVVAVALVVWLAPSRDGEPAIGWARRSAGKRGGAGSRAKRHNLWHVPPLARWTTCSSSWPSRWRRSGPVKRNYSDLTTHRRFPCAGRRRSPK